MKLSKQMKLLTILKEIDYHIESSFFCIFYQKVLNVFFFENELENDGNSTKNFEKYENQSFYFNFNIVSQMLHF